MRYQMLKANSLPGRLNNPELKKALSALEKVSFSDKEREEYEDRLKWLRIEANTLKKRYNIGKEEGRIEGKIEIAKKMFSKGIDIKDISDLTGLPKAEIEKIKTY